MKKLLTLAALAAVAASCTQSEVEDVKQSNEYIGIASATVNNMVLTRAGEGSPLNQGSLGLFVTTEGDDIFKVDNMRWNYGESGWTSYGNLAYEGNGKQTAYAYHPYRPEAATTSFNFTINDERTDLLWWKSDGQLTSNTLNVDFGHALSKLTINLKKNEEVAEEVLGQVTICGTKKNGMVDLTTQTWNTEAGEIADITTGEVELAEGFDKTVWSTLIPQTVSALTVSVEVGSKTYTWTGTEQEFLSGHAYTLNLTVGREVATIGEVNVTDWTLEETPEEGNADYVPGYLTGESLRTYMEQQLASNKDITVNLKPNASYADFRIIRDALQSAEVEDGTINLTILGVVYVPERVFSGNELGGAVDELKSISLPDVLEIGHSAFYYCNYLESVDASKVQKIGGVAFADCMNLTSVNFPEVLEMGNLMFRGTKLTSLDFPKLTLISEESVDGSFMAMPLLTSVNLPEVTRLPIRLFMLCEALTTVSIPKVTQIGDYAFGGCTNIETVQLTAEGEIEVSGSAWDIDPYYGESNPVNSQINLVLNKDKEEDVEDNEWKGFTFKSITFEE